MMTFRRGLGDFKLPLSTVWLMNDIAEAKGRQELYTKQSPQVLKALREMAMVESVESSNRIEGVTVAPDRLRPLKCACYIVTLWTRSTSPPWSRRLVLCSTFSASIPSATAMAGCRDC